MQECLVLCSVVSVKIGKSDIAHSIECIPRRIQKSLCDESMHVQRYDISGVQLLEDA